MHLYRDLMFLFSGVLFTLAALSWAYHGASRRARTLCLFLVAESLACFSYGMNLASGTLEAKLAWDHLEYLVGLPVVPLLSILALQATGYDRRPPAWTLAVLFAPPLLAIALNWTSRWHSLYYGRVWVEPVGGVIVLVKEPGPLYPVVFALIFVLLIAACVIFAWRVFRDRGPLRRGQIGLLGIALLAPIVFGMPYYGMRIHWLQHGNTLHAGFFLTALAFSAALFRGQIQGLLLELGQSKERNQLLMGNANAIFYTISPDGRFTYVSDSWEQFLGYRASEMAGRVYREVVLPEDVPACDVFLESVVRSGNLMSGIEYRVRHKNGSVRWHTSSIKPVLDSQGRALTFVGVAHDITKAKQTQEALRVVNDRLNALVASREKELRLAIAAALEAGAMEAKRIGQDLHDGVCQELVGLLRMAESIGHHGDASPDSEQAAGRLVKQAASVLVLARSVCYDLTLHDLDALSLYEALSAFARRFGAASGVVIELNYSPDQKGGSTPGAEHVYWVIREAVINAIRHGRARTIWIDVVHEREQMVVSVTNDGGPLPPGQVFKPGLGLRQMRMRAEQLGGVLTFGSNAQGQTIVELTVPHSGWEAER
jgi:PAS domain S-box-containing protein